MYALYMKAHAQAGDRQGRVIVETVVFCKVRIGSGRELRAYM